MRSLLRLPPGRTPAAARPPARQQQAWATPVTVGSNAMASVSARGAHTPPRTGRVAAAAAAAVVAASSTTPPPPSPTAPLVVLTREAGKNGKLASALARKGLRTVELPLVMSGPAADTAALPGELARPGGWGWVIVTSPEAAAVFLNAWRTAGRPPVRVAAVGAGTACILDEAPGDDAPAVAFTPSLANAVTLAAELPLPPGAGGDGSPSSSPPTVLYPASAKAGTDLQTGLAARGFAVTRLATYDTLPVPAGELDTNALAAARAASVVALASPSAVRAWVAAVGGLDAARAGPVVAAIGSTTGLAAQKAGLGRVHWPDAPGLDGFVSAVEHALADAVKKGAPAA
jgi:uroporphyrinogen-III synthase